MFSQDKDFIQRALVPIDGLCAHRSWCTAQVPVCMVQTQLEHPLHASSGLPAPTWAEILQHPFLLHSAIFHRHKHHTKQKEKTKQTNEKRPNMNLTACILHLGCLDPTSTASGQSGREHVQRETQGKQITQRGNKNTNQNV